jgi:pyruvate-formate lyase
MCASNRYELTYFLNDAKANPENYRDLIVRIGGFSAYFVQLSPAIQDDVIHRSEFNP